jgi:RsiW-degrading membrane proteinase PrsW (M82 family)
MKIVFSLLPVLLFLVSLFLLDSFKLVRIKTLILCLIWGMAAAAIAYYVNTFLTNKLSLNFNIFSRYLAPLVEETLKAVIIIYLISRQKIGFSIDAAIYGFAAGTGFALIENLVFLNRLGNDSQMAIWILRGFGTALMHGGCSAIIAMLLMDGIQREKSMIFSIFQGLLAGYLLHSSFNHFFLSPYLQTAIIFTLLPIVFTIVFQKSSNMLQNWLEIEFSNEVEILRMIKLGNFSGTKAGVYLISLKKHFDPEMIFDLYCYISLYLELSIKAKRNMMLKESGLQIIEEHDIMDKLIELKQLRKQIGKVGELAMQPLIRMKHRELWKLNQLQN